MKADHDQVTRLLKTARGQIDGILKMVEEDRYCLDVSNQLMATQSILKKANRLVLKAHMNCCVREAVDSGDPAPKLEELAALVETAGGTCEGSLLQNRDAPEARTFIGEGKVAEVTQLVQAQEADLVVFDNELSPSQQRVLTEEMGVQVPLRDKWYSRTRWISEFEFPITVTNYSADTFDLNGREISLSQADPLKGYENELLEMIGVSAEDYRIQQIRWDGEPYTDNGVLCRKLSASGEMRVADCHAEYAGVANLPSVEAKTVQAVYTDQPPARAGEQKSKYTYVIKATARYIPAAEPLSLIHISEPTRQAEISYAVFCLKKKKKQKYNT